MSPDCSMPCREAEAASSQATGDSQAHGGRCAGRSGGSPEPVQPGGLQKVPGSRAGHPCPARVEPRHGCAGLPWHRQPDKRLLWPEGKVLLRCQKACHSWRSLERIMSLTSGQAALVFTVCHAAAHLGSRRLDVPNVKHAAWIAPAIGSPSRCKCPLIWWSSTRDKQRPQHHLEGGRPYHDGKAGCHVSSSGLTPCMDHAGLDDTTPSQEGHPLLDLPQSALGVLQGLVCQLPAHQGHGLPSGDPSALPASLQPLEPNPSTLQGLPMQRCIAMELGHPEPSHSVVGGTDSMAPCMACQLPRYCVICVVKRFVKPPAPGDPPTPNPQP